MVLILVPITIEFVGPCGDNPDCSAFREVGLMMLGYTWLMGTSLTEAVWYWRRHRARRSS
jgi:hypothetical protein